MRVDFGRCQEPELIGLLPARWPVPPTGALLALAAVNADARRLASTPRRGLAAAAPAPAGGCAAPDGSDAKWIDPDTPGDSCSIQRCTADYETCTGGAPPSTTMQASAAWRK